MLNAFEIGINIIEETTTVLFMTLYFGCKYKDWRKYFGFFVTAILAISTITFFNSLYLYEGILGLTFIAIYYIYSLIFLKGDVYTKLFMAGFINCIVYFLALFSVLLVSIWSGQHVNQLFVFSIERIALIIISKVLLFAICAILLKFRFNNIANKRNMIILIIMPVIVEISMIGIMQVFMQNSELNSELFIATIGVMFANILTYYVFIKINKDARTEAEMKAMQQKYESDRKHAQDIEELYSKICGIRHDLSTHFSILAHLLEEDKDKAQEYIQAVTHNQLDAIKSFVRTDNECFNAIVNAKISLCDKFGISVQTRIMNRSLDRLNHDEIAIIFGNLFDNAIEASKESKKKNIQLDVQIQGEYLSISMMNSIDKSVLEVNESLRTTKTHKEQHGFGIKNIKRIVDEYNGMINYYEEDGYFCCDILML